MNECVEAEAWLRDKRQQQDSLPKYAPPVLLSAEIRKKAESVDRYPVLSFHDSIVMLLFLDVVVCGFPVFFAREDVQLGGSQSKVRNIIEKKVSTSCLTHPGFLIETV